MKCLTLESFLAQHAIDKVDFAKFNCEGGEFPVILNSDTATLRRFRSRRFFSIAILRLISMKAALQGIWKAADLRSKSEKERRREGGSSPSGRNMRKTVGRRAGDLLPAALCPAGAVQPQPKRTGIPPLGVGSADATKALSAQTLILGRLSDRLSETHQQTAQRCVPSVGFIRSRDSLDFAPAEEPKSGR